MPVTIRPLTAIDPVPISQAFTAIGWQGKTVDQYLRYLSEQSDGTRAVLVGSIDDCFAGYLNVLPRFHRMRVASRLMDAAEGLISVTSDTAGIGVGLHSGYAAAHLMYLSRGYRPDGRGVAYCGSTAKPGATVHVDDSLTLMMTRSLR